MGLFDNWQTVADNYELQEGQAVRFVISWFAFPGMSPGREELTRAIENNASVLVGEVNTPMFGPGAEVTGEFGPGWMTAAEFRAELYAAMADLNANRAVGVQQVSIGALDVLPPGASTTDPPAGGGPGLGTTISLASVAIIALVAFLFYVSIRKAL